MIRQSRLISGLILFAYVLTHFVNHSLGIVSIRAMETMLAVVYPIWSYPPVTFLLYGALVVHVALALYALWQRRSLKLLPHEAVQYLFGFMVPLLAAEHVTNTRIGAAFYGADFSHYENLLSALSYDDPVKGVAQMALLLVAWTHACIGLRFWLRLRSWYERAQPFLFAAALLVPVLALLGYVAGAREISVMLAQDPNHVAHLLATQPPPEVRPALRTITWTIRFVFFGAIALVLIARLVRHEWWRRKGVARISYPGGQSIEVVRGFTVLEASRLLGVPHASICGGKGRCSTCRVHVRAVSGVLPDPSSEELRVLRRIGAPPNVRLACQLQPRGAVEVTPLLPAFARARERLPRPVYLHGGERPIAVLFADLRDFTHIAETKLPYDVVFMLNRYSQAMGEAIETAGGYVNQFIGDGIMATFGLEAGARDACRQALTAARLMSVQLGELNRVLAPDLQVPLRMGLGIHFGPAIVGEMGYGRTRALTAVGDTVNTASRLESLCKVNDCELVVSEDLVTSAGMELPNAQKQETTIRGRSGRLIIHTVKSAREVPCIAEIGSRVSVQ